MNMNRLINKARSFQHNCDGSVAVMASLAILPAMMLLGAAIDYSNAANSRTRLQQATDATALALGKIIGEKTQTEVEEQGSKFFKALMKDDPGRPQIDRIEISPGKTKVTVYASTNYAPYIMRDPREDVQEVKLNALASTEVSNLHYEIALVFDTSGSMASSAGGLSKMRSAQNSAKRLIDIMYENERSAKRTKIALVPFAASVKVGSNYAGESWVDRTGLSSIHWQHLSKTGSSYQPQSRLHIFEELGIPFAGCFESRPGNFGVSDVGGSGSQPESLFVPQFAPDEPGAAGRSDYYTTTGTHQKKNDGDKKTTYDNSYLDDNGGACDGAVPAGDKPQERQARVCKYKINRNSTKLSLSNDRGPNHRCDVKPIARLTSDKDSLKAQIDALVADGKNTNLFEGAMWGWRTLSPNNPFADGRPHEDPEARKILVLMTDGENAWNDANNHNGSLFGPFGYYKDARIAAEIKNSGQARTAIDNKTKTACQNAKAAGVKIYTIGFSTSKDPLDNTAKQLLKACATSETMAYIASNSTELETVFEEIAYSIGALRVTR